MIRPQIIGITGMSGAGKTTLARSLAQKLQSIVLHWDEFDEISKGPEDHVDWYHRSKDYQEWDYPALAGVLQTLKSGASAVHPISGASLPPTNHIVVDAPMGRLHEQTGQYLDMCIHIDVPLDISLGRRLLRDFKLTDKTKDELLEDIDFYLSKSRPLFSDDRLKEKACFCIDGMVSTDQQVQAILAYLQSKKLKPIKGINHITLAVNDIERSFRFYKDFLGFTPLCKWEGSAYFLVGDLWFCLDRDMQRQSTGCSTHYAFSVSAEDFKAMSDRIIKSGATIFKENTSPGDSLYFLDPDGHKLEIHVGDWRSRITAKKENPGNWKNVEWFI